MQNVFKLLKNLSNQILDNSMDDKLLQLELDMDRAKRDIHELRDIVIGLSYMIGDIDKKVTQLIEQNSSETNF